MKANTSIMRRYADAAPCSLVRRTYGPSAYIKMKKTVLAGVPQMPKRFFFACGNPANAQKCFFRFAGTPQTPKSAFFDLRESRKRPKVLFLICGNPASNKKFIFFHCGTPASVSKNFLSFADTVATRLVYLSSTDVSKTIHTGIFLPIVLRLKPGVTSPRAFLWSAILSLSPTSEPEHVAGDPKGDGDDEVGADGQGALEGGSEAARGVAVDIEADADQ